MKRFIYLCFLVYISVFSANLAIELAMNLSINIDSILDFALEGIGYGFLGGVILKVFDRFPDTTDKEDE